MPTANTAARYGTPARVLHWLTALLIMTNLPVGLIANRLAYDTADAMAQKAQLFSIHKTLGVAAFAVALVRIIWALTQARPAGLHPERRAETALAEAVHWTLYISLVAVPLTGWVGHAASVGYAPILWPPGLGWIGQGLPLVPMSESVGSAAHSLHWVFTKLLALSILLHIAGALKHHLIDRDATLRRMWRGDAASPRAPRRAALAPLVIALGVYMAGAAVAVSLTAQPEPTVASVPAAAPAPTANAWRVTQGTLTLGVVQMGSEVKGSFSAFTDAIDYDPATRAGTVTASIDIASLTLGSVTAQAREAEFFDATAHPLATFTGIIAAATSGGPNDHVATGTLTMKGAAIPLTLPFTLVLDGDTARATGEVTLQRLDFGIGPSFPDEATVGYGVTVTLDLAATRAD